MFCLVGCFVWWLFSSCKESYLLYGSKASLALAGPGAVASRLWEPCVAITQLRALPHHKLTSFCALSIYKRSWLVPAFAHCRQALESPVKFVGVLWQPLKSVKCFEVHVQKQLFSQLPLGRLKDWCWTRVCTVLAKQLAFFGEDWATVENNRNGLPAWLFIVLYLNPDLTWTQNNISSAHIWEQRALGWVSLHQNQWRIQWINVAKQEKRHWQLWLGCM